MLHSATHKTPVGELSIIVEEHVLLAAGFKSLENLKARLSPLDSDKEIKHIENIPVISYLISDYFDGNLNAFNPIKVRRKIFPGSLESYAENSSRKNAFLCGVSQESGFCRCNQSCWYSLWK
jgi:methylated-DNA-[protein]-cysteine S-methyltransferase